MRIRATWLLWLALVLLPWGRAAAAESDDAQTTLRVDLITIGPGDAFLTRAGHTALLVTERDADGRELGTVYNYGDADFGDPWLALRFLFARQPFFASVTGDLYDTTLVYGHYQDRSMIRQPVALTQAQARQLAALLEHDTDPEHREYDYHYLEQTCSTKVRDRLDEVTGGELRQQLSGTDPWTIRDYQQLTFDDMPLIALLGDVLFGRLHDRPITKYYALLWPERVSTYLGEVMVPDPAGSDRMVPLLGPPVVLYERGGPPRTQERNHLTWIVAPLLGLWGLLGGIWVATRGRSRRRLAALWLASWSLPAGLLGTIMLLLQLTSTVPELRSNEHLLALPFTDLALVVLAARWWRRGVELPRGARVYASVRLVVVGAVVLARALGLLVQQPWVIPLGSLGCAVGLLWIVRRVGRGDPP